MLITLSLSVIVQQDTCPLNAVIRAVCMFGLQVEEIHKGLSALREMVSNLENKQKTVLGVALPEDSELVPPGHDQPGHDQASTC